MKITKNNKIIFYNKDLWSGDVTLAGIIYSFLKKYRDSYNKGNCSYPSDFIKDIERYSDLSDLKVHPEKEDEGFKQWLECLDTMIYSFKWMAQEKDDFPNSKEHPYWKTLKHWPKKDEYDEQLFQDYHKKELEHYDLIQKGIDLFAKHFKSLWI